MKFTPLDIPDVIIIEPRVFGDNRGFFFESYRKDVFAAHGIAAEFVQDNNSSSVKNTVRGLHYQLAPHAQGKLVRVTRGEVYDVAVDIRRGSPTFGRAAGCIISAENRKCMYVPPGFAHGFCVLSDVAEFHYKCTALYAPAHERGILWNDPALGIAWPIDCQAAILSQKDLGNPPLATAEINYTYARQ